jgi:outer membrane receptor protein involved in Fe transport
MRWDAIKRLLWPIAMGGQLVWPAMSMATGDAETASSGALEEVVVTATRREERLQDVPISVTAFSQEKLDSQGLKNIDDLSRLSPGLTFQRNGTGSSADYNDEGSDINIRGIDSTAGTSTTGVYVDDTPIQTRHLNFGAVNPFPQLFDLDRVEVLRGPQGTQFGAGAEGGVVRFIAPEPNLHKSAAYVRGDVAQTKNGDVSYEGGAAFGAPIIEDLLAFRVSASYRRDGGWVDRVGYTLVPNSLNQGTTPTPVYNGITTEKNSNTWETVTARVALKWKPNDDVEVIPSVYYQHLKVADTAAYWIALSDPASSRYRNGNARKNSSDDPFTVTALKITWDVGFADFYSNTSFLARDMTSNSDYTQYLRATWTSFGLLPNTFPQSPADGGYALFHDSQRNFYQEFRLTSKDPSSRFIWSGGLFYSHLKENVPEQIIDPTIDAEVIAFTGNTASLCYTAQPCPGGVIANTPLYQVIDKQIAAFGELTVKLTDEFKITGGLRYSKIDYAGSVNSFGPFIGATIVAQAAGTEKPVTPKVLVSWQPDRDNLVYASASKGFRPGGPNAVVGSICNGSLTPIGLTQVPGQFQSDSLWSYELGTKNTFLDHTLQIDASVYYIDWSNIQNNIYLSSCGEQFTANLGHAKSQGGEIELIYKPIQALTLDATAAYVDGKLTKTSCAGTLAASNNRCGPAQVAPLGTKGDALLSAPWSLTAAAEYHFTPWGNATPYARVDFQYTTAQTSLVSFQNPNNGVSDPTIPGLPVTRNLSLRAGARFSGVDLSVYANNLTNDHPLLYAARDIYPIPFNSPTTDTLYFGRGVRPLTVGVTATYRY